MDHTIVNYFQKKFVYVSHEMKEMKKRLNREILTPKTDTVFLLLKTTINYCTKLCTIKCTRFKIYIFFREINLYF